MQILRLGWVRQHWLHKEIFFLILAFFSLFISSYAYGIGLAKYGTEVCKRLETLGNMESLSNDDIDYLIQNIHINCDPGAMAGAFGTGRINPNNVLPAYIILRNVPNKSMIKIFISDILNNGWNLEYSDPRVQFVVDTLGSDASVELFRTTGVYDMIPEKAIPSTFNSRFATQDSWTKIREEIEKELSDPAFTIEKFLQVDESKTDEKKKDHPGLVGKEKHSSKPQPVVKKEPDKVKEQTPDKTPVEPKDDSDSQWAYWLTLLGLIPLGLIVQWIRRKRKQ